MGFVGDEEVVEVAGDEPGACRVLADHADDVFAVEVAGVVQEGLLAVVVVFLFVLEEPVVTADGTPGQLGLDSPPSEGPGAIPDVFFSV